MRLIDADALKQDWLFRGDDGKPYRDTVDAQPTVESERKTGRWIPLQLSLEHPPYQCSCCFSNPPMITKKDKWRKQHLEAVLSPYCPNCGANMEVEHDNQS